MSHKSSSQKSKQEASDSRRSQSQKSSKSATLPPLEQYGQQKKVVLTPEQIEKSSEKLYVHPLNVLKQRDKEYRHDVDIQLRQNCIKSKLIHSELTEKDKAAIHTLYDQQILTKNENQKKIEKKYEPVLPTMKQIVPDEEEQIADRLYNQAMASQKQSRQKAEEKVYGTGPKGLGQRQLTADEQKASVESVYTKAVQLKQDKDSKLGEKYLWKRDNRTISKETIDKLNERLKTKSGK